MTTAVTTSVLEKLKQLQGNLTDQDFANKLGIHRVSWQRIKNQRVPVSDKFLVRLHRAFPELNIFLVADATMKHTKATSGDITTPSENARDGKLGRLRGWLRSIIRGVSSSKSK